MKAAIESSPWFGNIDAIFVGDAKGVDSLVVRWCKENGITYRVFKAQWNLYGKSAGPERNGEMIRAGGEALIAIWDGESKGTKNMIEQARRCGLPPAHIKIVDYVDQQLAKPRKAKGIMNKKVENE